MITCPNCLKKHNDGTHYCDECGFDLLNDIPDPSAADSVNTEDVVPDMTEETVQNNEEVATETPEEETHASDEYDFLNIDGEGDDMPYDRVKTKKKNSRKIRRFNKKKTVKIVSITLAALIFVSAAVFSLWMIFGEKPYPGYALYVKDDELMYRSFDSSTAITLPVYVEDVVDFRLFGSLCRLSDDGTSLIFAQEYSYGDSVIDLSYINLALPNPTPVNIGYNALAYSVNKAADTITYLKESDDGNKLFRYTVYNGNRMQIDVDVNRFIASEDGESIIFYDTSSGVHRFDGSKSIQLATDATIAWGADKNLYFYREEESDGLIYNCLYYFDGKESVKLIDDCFEVITLIDETYGALVLANDDGEDVVYYVVKDVAVPLDIVDIDYFMNNVWVDEDGKTMYYLDEVDENESDDYSDPTVVFEGLLYKAKLTKKGIKEIVEIDEDVNNGFYMEKGKFVYTKNTEYTDGIPTFDVYLNEEFVDELINAVLYMDGKYLICMAEYDDETDTYSIFRDGSRVDRGVVDAFMIDDELMYVKRSEDEEEELYDLYDADGDCVVSGMFEYDWSAEDKIVIYSNWDHESNSGNLSIYENGELTELGGDIHIHSITLSGDVVYAKDVDSTYCGDIYYLKDGVEYRIEKDIDISYMDIIDCIGTIRDGNYVSVEEANYLADEYFE
jgi:hypothetical protein